MKSKSVVTLAFDVRDQDSAIQKAEYSLDGTRWQMVYPKDGIADSRQEQFELTLEGEFGRGSVLRARVRTTVDLARIPLFGSIGSVEVSGDAAAPNATVQNGSGSCENMRC